MVAVADRRDDVQPALEKAVRLLSLVVPVRDEQDAIGPFLERTLLCVATAIERMGEGSDYEIVFVDDGSTDSTLAAIISARIENPRIKSIVFSRNFGKEAAVAAGLRYAEGDAVIPIDVDLQDPPEIIPGLVARWLDGAKMVTAVRVDRRSDSLFKRLTAGAFYTVYNRMADRAIQKQAGDFRLLDRQIVDALNELPERARFMKGLFSWVGFETTQIEYVREPRSAGKSKWGYWRLWNLALDGITASTTVPLRIWTYCGMFMGFVALLYALFIIGRTLILGRDLPGYASLMTAVLFIGGLNLLALGILGEYIGRISNEVKARPLYVLKTAIGFEGSRSSRSGPETS